MSASWILPSSARLAGAQNSFWVTDLTIANFGAGEASLLLKFLGNNQDGRPGPERTFPLGAGQSITFQDALQSIFGIDSGYGALLLNATSPFLSLSGQTYTAGAGGAYGQSVPATSLQDWIQKDAPHSILAVREDESFRTNLILANPTELPMEADVALFNDSGEKLGEKRYSLYPLGMIQISKVISSLGASVPLRFGRLQLSTSTPGGAFSAYASVIDNVTNDPRTLLPSSGSGWLLPSSARVNGAGNSFWSTGVTLANLGDSPVEAVLQFLGNNADGREGLQKSLLIEAGKSAMMEDILGSLFGLESGYGALVLTPASSSLHMVSQTSTPGAGGTYGQSVPSQSTRELITCATPGSISAIREDANFRTNLILANACEFAVDVELTLIDGAGMALGKKQCQLFPRGMTQINRIAAQGMGFSGELAEGRLELRALTPGGAFAAYASMIDNVTNDPRTLLPTLHREWLSEATLFGEGAFAGIKMCGMTFEPDGKTLFLGNNKGPGIGLEIVRSRLENGSWTIPVSAEFSRSYKGLRWDFGPCIAPDGQSFFFASGRPVSGNSIKDDDIWVMEKIGNSWGEPRNLGLPVNTSNYEYMPTVARDGTLYYSLGGDLYCSRKVNGQYEPPAKLPYPLNFPGKDENSPFVTPQGDLLIFSSDRPGGFGDYDLYFSRKNGEYWSAPENLGPKVNSSLRERYPTLSPDGKSLFFNRDKEGISNFEIYEIDASVLGLN